MIWSVLSQMTHFFFRLSSLPPWAKLLGLLTMGLLLAHGRYDWPPNPALAFRCWTLSAYFFTLILVGAYTGALAFGYSERRLCWPVLAIATVLLNLPYRWLGLERFFYLKNRPSSYGVEKNFVPEWLGHGHRFAPWNATDTLLLILLIIAILGSIFLRQSAFKSRRATFVGPLPYRFFLLLFAFITVETWLHLSNRSPNTYISHFEQPDAAHYVYAWKMLPDGRGVVNADFGYFSRLEELYLGYSPETTVLFVRRAFPYYISAHLSYFIGAYHSFLVLNLLFWLAAIMSVFLLARDFTGSGTIAASAAALTACGPGFIMYGAQPMSYVANYAMIAMLILLYHRLANATRLQSFAPICTAGIFLGLTMLTYDSFAWALFFVLYALIARTSVWRAIVAVGIGWSIYAGFFLLIFTAFKFVPEHSNDQYIGLAIGHLVSLIQHPKSALIFPLLSSAISNYCAQLTQVNFFVPCLLALVGLFFGRAPRLRAVALLLLLPSFVTSVVLYMGEAPSLYLAGMPRFNYPSYPGVVLLAALGLSVFSQFWLDRDRRWLAGLSVGLPLLACVVLSNADAFGFMQHLYYHFYWNSGGYFGRP